MPEVKEATTDKEILACWPAVRELRTHLIPDEFVERVRLQQGTGFHLMYVKDDSPDGQEELKVTSILTYRTHHSFFRGKMIYIDDFSTLPAARGKGHGGALMDWMISYAKANGFQTVALDGQFGGAAAHRLYMNKGFVLRSHHFDLLLGDTASIKPKTGA